MRASLKGQPQVEQHVLQVDTTGVVEVAIGLAHVDPATAPPWEWHLADLTLLAEEAHNIPGPAQTVWRCDVLCITTALFKCTPAVKSNSTQSDVENCFDFYSTKASHPLTG